MASVARIEIRGLKELDRKLRDLSREMRGKILEEAVAEAGKVVLPVAIANCPEGQVESYLKKTYKGNLVWHPGFAKRNVAMKTFVSRDRRAASVIIGVKREAYYAINFVELNARGRQGTPWLQPAFEQTKDQQIDAFGVKIVEKIGSVARRYRTYG